MAKLIWNGDEVSAAVKLASRRAIDDTTRQAAAEARVEHWWKGHPSVIDGTPSNLESNTISERGPSTYQPAEPLVDGAAGRFGTTRRQGFYGYFLELREPFLRPIGDRVFPHLPERLRDRFGAQ